MASEVSSKCRIITAEESTAIYGLRPGKEIKIEGASVTDAKVSKVVGAYMLFINSSKGAQKEVLTNYNKFRAVCKEQGVEFTVR